MTKTSVVTLMCAKKNNQNTDYTDWTDGHGLSVYANPC